MSTNRRAGRGSPTQTRHYATAPHKGLIRKALTGLVTAGLALGGIIGGATSAAAETYHTPDPYNPALYTNGSSNCAVMAEVLEEDGWILSSDISMGAIMLDDHDLTEYFGASTRPTPDTCYKVRLEFTNKSSSTLYLSMQFVRDARLGELVLGGSIQPWGGSSGVVTLEPGASTGIYDLYVGLPYQVGGYTQEDVRATGGYGWYWTMTTSPVVPTEPPTVPGDGSLTITKLASATEDLAGHAIAGAEFTVVQVPYVCAGATSVSAYPCEPPTRVTFDFDTNIGWTSASETSVEDIALAAAYFGTIPANKHVGVTDSAGKVTFTGLPMSLYYVVESHTPVGIMEKSIPFIVTIPTTNSDGDGWDYSVDAIPKNQMGITKRIINPTEIFTVDDEIEYQILVSIPKLPSSMVFRDDFSVSDILDPRLNLVTTSDGTPWWTVEFIGDYVTAANESIFAGIANDIIGTHLGIPTEVKFQFDPDHLASLSTLGSHAQLIANVGDLKMVITFKVRANTQGEIPNGGDTTTFRCYYGDGAGEPPWESCLFHSNVVTVKFGGESFWKYAADLTHVDEVTEADLESATSLGDYALNGAQFVLFADVDDATACAHDLEACTDDLTAAGALWFYNDLALTGRTQVVTTDAAGQAIFGGLVYGIEDGTTHAYTPPTFWAVEIKAPKLEVRPDEFVQYELLPNPIELKPVTGNADGIYYGAPGSSRNGADDMLVPNVPHNGGFEIPNTGGLGTLMYFIIGGLVLTMTTVVIRRQKKEITA